jgi:hypothetical protein
MTHKMTVRGAPGRWTEDELRAAELLRLGATEESICVELGCTAGQLTRLRKRKGFNDLLGLQVGPVQGYAEKWQAIRERQLSMASKALDTIEEAMDDREEDGRVSVVALRASEGLIKSLEKGVPKDGPGQQSPELASFLGRLAELAEEDAAEKRRRIVDVPS